MITTPALPNRVLRSTALFLSMLLLTGCHNTSSPRFEAVGVREVEREGDRSVIEFSVLATNPNPDPIPLRTISYRVRIGDEVVFEGVRSPETTLHNYSTHEFILPAVIPSEMLLRSFQYELHGSVQYIPPGRLSEVLFDAEILVPEAALDLVGSVDVGE